jgi:hypothetical protein
MTAKEFFSKGRERGSRQCQKGIDNSVTLKKLAPKTEKDYQRMVGLWKQYVIPMGLARPSSLADPLLVHIGSPKSTPKISLTHMM